MADTTAGGGNILKTIFGGVKTLATDPLSAVNPQTGRIDVPALFDPQRRETFKVFRELQPELARLEAQSQAMQIAERGQKLVETIFGQLSSSPTDMGQAAQRQAMEQAGVDPGLLATIAPGATEGRKKTRQAAKALPAEAGISPEMARVMPLEDVSQVAQQGSQAKFTRGTQYQQAALTQANQANQAALARETAAINRTGEFGLAKQKAKMEQRIKARGERQTQKPFTQASERILAFAQTPEGQEAFKNNPAMRAALGVAQAVTGGGPMIPEVGGEVLETLTSAAQKGATAQGTPEQFGMSTSTQTDLNKRIVDTQNLMQQSEVVLATFKPEWATLKGRGKLLMKSASDVLGGNPQELAEFRAWVGGAADLYSRNKLELTGQASTAQESAEIQRIIPNPESLGPQQIGAALQTFAAAKRRQFRYLSKMQEEGRVALTEAENDFLILTTLMDMEEKKLVAKTAVNQFFGKLPVERRAAVKTMMQEEAGAQP